MYAVPTHHKTYAVRLIQCWVELLQVLAVDPVRPTSAVNVRKAMGAVPHVQSSSAFSKVAFMADDVNSVNRRIMMHAKSGNRIRSRKKKMVDRTPAPWN